MEGAIEFAGRVAVLVFVVTCMVTAGLSLDVRDVVAPLRRGRLMVFALVANFVAAPGIAWALARLFGLDAANAFGLILLGGAAGAPFLPRLAGLARGDIAFSVALMLMLTVGSAVFMPVALPLLIPGLSADAWSILLPLLVTMMLPLSIGMLVRGRSGRWASYLRAPFAGVSNASMIAAVVLLIGLHWRAMIGTFGSGAVAAAILFVLATLAVGYAMGGPAPATRSVLGLGTGQRNIAAALIVATGNSDDPQVVIMLLVSTLVGLLVLVPSARYLARGPSVDVGVQARTAGQAIREEVAR